jgi:hypothetical protein
LAQRPFLKQIIGIKIMSKLLIEKQQKTKNRIEKIKANLKSHKKNIKSLNLYVTGQVKPKKGEPDQRIVKFSCIPKCKKRFHWTLQNLTTQITLLEQELAILIEYGV